MSTIKLTFSTQALDFSPLTRGQIDIVFNAGTSNIVLTERLTVGTAFSGYFKEVSWNGDPLKDNEQAINFAQAFNRDFKNVGGSKNLGAKVTDNEVTITAKTGTFPNGSQYTGNVLVVGGFVVDNTIITPPIGLTVTKSDIIGNCNTIQYSATLTGGTPNYTLVNGGTTLETAWDGASTTFNLERGLVHSLKAKDADGTEKIVSVNVPRKHAIGEFKERVTSFDGYSDILIEKVVNVSGVGPIEYSLDEEGTLTGGSYQTANTFPGVLPGLYELFVKDVYGCELTKTIEIREFQDATVDEKIIYFDIPEGQSIIFSEMPEFNKDVKKNYFNTGSYNQTDLVLYNAVHKFDANEKFIGVQFWTSYDFHIITIHKCDGTKVDVGSTIIQENLGVKEKMDCKLFEVGDKTGVYFQGGNTYVPDTDTVLDSNDFNGTTPRWVEEGQLIFIDGLGGFYIESTGYDADYGGYFVIDLTTPSELSAKVQLTYNRHDYNIWEAYFNPSDFNDKCFVIFEKGFNDTGNVDGNPWVSEQISKLSNTDNLLKFEWSDTLNKGNIVFQSGITFLARMKGEFNPTWLNVSETEEGDDRDYSIEQSTRLGFEILVEAINQKQVTQLNIASSLNGFKVNNLLLVRKKAPEIRQLGKSNLWTWKCEFGYGDNNVAVKKDEIVLSVSTGVEGGGSTGKSAIPDLSGVTLYKNQSGNLVKIGSNLSKTS